MSGHPTYRRQHVVGAIQIGVDRGKFVVERGGDNTLCCQMIALVGLKFRDDIENACKALHASGFLIELSLPGFKLEILNLSWIKNSSAP